MSLLKIKFIIESVLENIALVCHAAEGIYSNYSFEQKEPCLPIDTIIAEAVTNAIKHAYENQDGHEVEIIVEKLDKGMAFKVCDWGVSINPQVLIEKDVPVAFEVTSKGIEFNISATRPIEVDPLMVSGRGLNWICLFFDEVTYYTDDKMNVLYMFNFFTTPDELK
ncbi:ATP-binding protein [Desulfococcaceae bacterium HSG7]|nr:ATP-binding protein [Desulfococcaceae bacterium HSG7]